MRSTISSGDMVRMIPSLSGTFLSRLISSDRRVALRAASYTVSKMRAHHLAQLSEMRQVSLAVKKWPTEFTFELLDRTRERRLRHVALFRRAREVQFLRHRDEVTNLMHFHNGLTGIVDEGPSRRWLELGRILRSLNPG